MSDYSGEAKKVDEETIKKLTELRAYLEERIKKLETETSDLKTLLWVLDQTIAEKSFRRPEIFPTPVAPPLTPVEYKQVIPLKTATGIPLAKIYVGEDIARITPAEGVTFNVNTPPFRAFLITRVLDPMLERDKEAVQRGKLPPDEILSYNVVQEGDIIKEIIIRNFRDVRRLREIKTSVRWTLEKMYEKTTSLR